MDRAEDQGSHCGSGIALGIALRIVSQIALRITADHAADCFTDRAADRYADRGGDLTALRFGSRSTVDLTAVEIVPRTTRHPHDHRYGVPVRDSTLRCCR